MPYKRVLLKLSGESLSRCGESCFCADSLCRVSDEIARAHDSGYQIGLVVGGGNICRGGRSGLDVGRICGDYMGIASTVINALALQGYLHNRGIPVKIYSAVPFCGIVYQFHRQDVLRCFDEGYVVIFAGGTGHPFFTTDTAAVLRAVESQCDVVLKCTHVDGIYDSDPKCDPTAKRYDVINYVEVIDKGLKIMDFTAISLAMESNMPIVVFNIDTHGELMCVLRGGGRFSVIK